MTLTHKEKAALAIGGILTTTLFLHAVGTGGINTIESIESSMTAQSHSISGIVKNFNEQGIVLRQQNGNTLTFDGSTQFPKDISKTKLNNFNDILSDSLTHEECINISYTTNASILTPSETIVTITDIEPARDCF